MSCNDIEIIEKQETITITDQQEVISLDSELDVDIEVTSQNELVELKEDEATIIQVANVNGLFVGVGQNYEKFTPANGQTIFTLGNILSPEQIMLSKVFINGQKIALTTCYTISGSQLTVILPYQLNGGDILEIYY
jgi:hypothetical protein